MAQEMTTTVTPLPDQDTIMAEMEGLQRDLLQRFVVLLGALTWGWLLVVGTISSRPLNQAVPTVIAVTGGLLSLWLRQRSYPWACRVLVVAAIGALISLEWANPDLALVRALGVIVVMAATSLLGATEGAASAMLTYIALTGVLHGEISRTTLLAADNAGYMLLYLVTLIAATTAQGMLGTTVRWSLEGWTRARASLDEVRSRRRELYRALRALEEATYRIERMNNELIVARRDAEIAQSQKARFAATVSHELRGPLNIVLGFGRMMALHPERYGNDLTPQFMQDVDAVYRNTQHLAALVDDVLDLSQIDAERIPLVKDRIDIRRDVLDKAIDIIRPLVDGKGLALHVDIASELPWLLADQVRIRQVVINLLNNAVRHTDEGSITVSAALDHDAVVVTVSDTGDGIAPSRHAELFQPFHQLRPEQRTGVKSSGLGLSISKQLIELHGGRIWLKSDVGQGATFSFSIPLPGMSQANLVETEDAPELVDDEQRGICLVVHPDQDMIRLLARHVEGYRVVGVLDVHDLATLIERLHPQAILVGTEQAELVQETVETLHYDIPTIVCGMSAGDDIIRGVRSHLIKPISAEMVGAVMRTINDGYSERILVVDDNPDEARLVERYLMDMPRPCTIAKAYSGVQAMASMAVHKPDLVFMDVVMPEMDGLTTVTKMQEDPELRDIPVVMVSARDWIDEHSDISMPVVITQKREMDIAQLARILGVLLNALQPSYLDDSPPEPTTPG